MRDFIQKNKVNVIVAAAPVIGAAMAVFVVVAG